MADLIGRTPGGAGEGPKLIVALDYSSLDPALAMVERLGNLCRFYKVGSELFTAEGPRVVSALQSRGADVFLDLKFHDIPNTVGSAVRSAAALGARLVTVHAAGGRAMLEAAVAASGLECGVLAVTVLTSLDDAALARAWGRPDALDTTEEVLRLAGEARAAGAHGVVCSGLEAAALHARHGDALRLLVPGIRLEGGEAHDQRRVVTPAAAAQAGASYLVLGRTVTGSADPVAAMRRVQEDVRTGITRSGA